MNFVQKLASGEVTIDADSAVAPGNSKEWAEEFAGQEGAGPNGGYWDRLEKEWQEARWAESHVPQFSLPFSIVYSFCLFCLPQSRRPPLAV